MNEIIEGIKKAVNNECYLAALSLSLILPDICAQVEFSDMYNKKGGQGKAYAAWYYKYIYPYENSPDDNEKLNKFDGIACYKSRCNVLHNGSTDIDNILKEKYGTDKIEFELKKHGISYGYIEYEENKYYILKIGVEDLCMTICSTAQLFFEKRKTIFPDFPNLIVDIDSLN